MARQPTIYFAQFGAFWSLPLDRAKSFFDQCIADEGSYDDLDKSAKRLSGQPRDIFKSDSGGYWSARSLPSGGLYEPLDWSLNDFKTARAELDEYISDV